MSDMLKKNTSLPADRDDTIAVLQMEIQHLQTALDVAVAHSDENSKYAEALTKSISRHEKNIAELVAEQNGLLQRMSETDLIASEESNFEGSRHLVAIGSYHEELQASNEELQSLSGKLRESNESLEHHQNMLDTMVQERIAALKASESRMREVSNPAVDAMIIVNDEERVRAFNPSAERLFGHRAEEVIGAKISALVDGTLRSEIRRFLNHDVTAAETKDGVIVQRLYARHKDGSHFPVECALATQQVENKRLTTVFLRDISEKNKAEARIGELQEELMHASRLASLGEINGAIAHEISQPMLALYNYAIAARTMLDDPGRRHDTEKIEKLVENIISEHERITTIMRRLRAMTRKGASPLLEENIATVVEDAMALGLLDAGRLGIKVTLDIPDDLPKVSIDKVQIQQVLLNLFRNAINALQEVDAPRIRIQCRWHDSGWMTISVVDNGHGVPDEARDNLFKPFATSKEDGIGLGLAVSRSILIGHGGTLYFNPAPEGGAAFTLSIPVAESKDGTTD